MLLYADASGSHCPTNFIRHFISVTNDEASFGNQKTNGTTQKTKCFYMPMPQDCIAQRTLQGISFLQLENKWYNTKRPRYGENSTEQRHF